MSGNSQIDIGPGVGATNDQYAMLIAAGICGGSINVSGKSVTIKAFGAKPDINIPITVTVREG